MPFDYLFLGQLWYDTSNKMCKSCKVKKNKNISPKTSPNINNKTTLQIPKNQPYKKKIIVN